MNDDLVAVPKNDIIDVINWMLAKPEFQMILSAFDVGEGDHTAVRVEPKEKKPDHLRLATVDGNPV